MSSFVLIEIKQSGSNSPTKIGIIEEIHKLFGELNKMEFITDPRNMKYIGYFSQNKVLIDPLIEALKKIKGYTTVVKNIHYTETLKKR